MSRHSRSQLEQRTCQETNPFPTHNCKSARVKKWTQFLLTFATAHDRASTISADDQTLFSTNINIYDHTLLWLIRARRRAQCRRCKRNNPDLHTIRLTHVCVVDGDVDVLEAQANLVRSRRVQSHRCKRHTTEPNKTETKLCLWRRWCLRWW